MVFPVRRHRVNVSISYIDHLPSVVELLFLLSNLAVDLLSDLAELQLGSQHLVLLGLQGTFSLLQSSLQLLFLGL